MHRGGSELPSFSQYISQAEGKSIVDTHEVFQVELHRFGLTSVRSQLESDLAIRLGDQHFSSIESLLYDQAVTELLAQYLPAYHEPFSIRESSSYTDEKEMNALLALQTLLNNKLGSISANVAGVISKSRKANPSQSRNIQLDYEVPMVCAPNEMLNLRAQLLAGSLICLLVGTTLPTLRTNSACARIIRELMGECSRTYPILLAHLEQTFLSVS